MRLHKFLAKSGVASRRASEELIASGRVSVNDKVIMEMGVVIDPDHDIIKLDNQVVELPNEQLYIMMNKPVGYLTTKQDPQGRPTIYDIIPVSYQHLFPVGRLDKDSEGLLLLTNDGQLAEYLAHPRYQHSKEYRVNVDKDLNHNIVRQLKAGIILDEGLARADEVKIINNKVLDIVLHQGWKRQIRRMLQALGYEVVKLQRRRLGKYNIVNMGNKDFIIVSKTEII
ncbi:MAG: pseudouridine synthase [Candidatus Komeilibacteria bacterium]